MQLNKTYQIGGLVFHSFLFKNTEWIQEASFTNLSKTDTHPCTAYDVPQRPLQWHGNFGFLLSTCCCKWYIPETVTVKWTKLSNYTLNSAKHLSVSTK